VPPSPAYGTSSAGRQRVSDSEEEELWSDSPDSPEPSSRGWDPRPLSRSQSLRAAKKTTLSKEVRCEVGGGCSGVGLGRGGPDPSLPLPRALPGSCVAGAGGKSRTADGSRESRLPRVLNTSLLLRHREGATVRAPPGPGEGAPPAMTL